MSVIFAETFSGSGALDSTTPSTLVGFGSEVWSSGGITKSGGFAISPYASGPAYDVKNATFNDPRTSYSQSTDFELTFQFRTGADVTSSTYLAFSLNAYINDLETASVLLTSSAGDWDITVGNEEAPTGYTSAVAANTTYTGTITYTRASGGLVSVTFMGTTTDYQPTSFDSGTSNYLPGLGDANGFRGLFFSLNSGVSLDSISVDALVGAQTGNANLTSPALTAKGYGAGRSALTFSPLTSVGYGGGNAPLTSPSPTLYSIYNGATGMFDKPSPMLRLSATGTVTGGVGYVALNSPMLTSDGAAGGSAALSLPSVTLEATGHNSDGERSLSHTFSALTLSAYGAGKTVMSAPSPSLLVTGTFANSGAAALAAPTLALSSTGRVSNASSAALTMPTAQLIGYGGALLSVTVGSATMAASGTSGSVGRAAVSLPLFDLTASGTARDLSGADLTLPMLRAVPVGKADLTLPIFTLTAIGTAVVTATYEAYSINLNHLPKRGVEPVDEMTRYTSFPFTQVVRYKNSYFGVGADGNLYLLEGTADVAAPIPWAFKTAITDFDSPTKKTIASGYFSGRFGPASAIALYSGEDGGTTYSYSTPRDALAQNHRQNFGKGLKERYYSIGASGTGTLELDKIELDVHNLSRRI